MVITLVVSVANALAAEASALPIADQNQARELISIKQYSSEVGVSDTALMSEALAIPEPDRAQTLELIQERESENTVGTQAQDMITQEPSWEYTDANISEQAQTWQLIEQDSTELGTSNEVMEQVTSVSHLADVQPTDWALLALQSLVERYGCIGGYPDGTYRGTRALTRYEFAAGLNACLERISELIATTTTNLIAREDLLALQQLQKQFTAELASLRGRVDALEVTTAELVTNQFSTTTKLNGIANFAIADVLSGEGDNEATLQARARLTFNTSFTGRDLLVNRIAAGNAVIPNLAGGTSEVVQTHQWYGNFNNDFFQVTLYYLFPIGEKLFALITPAGGLHADYTLPADFLFEDFDAGTTSLSTFAQRNPIYRLGGGSGVAFLYNISDSLSLSAGYYAGEAFNAAAGRGLFNGTYSALAQIAWKPTKQLTLSAAYHHGYFSQGQFGFGDNSPAFVVLGNYAGTGVVNDTLAQFPTVTNSYAAQASWRVSSNFAIAGWVGLTDVRAIGVGDGEVWNYALTLAFPDLGKEGSLGGLVIGAQPYLASLEGVAPFSNDTPLHIEAFYRYQLTDNIAITPGIIWLTAPNQNADNEDIIITTLRTTFTF